MKVIPHTPDPRITEKERTAILRVAGDLYSMQVPEGTEWAPSIPKIVQPITEPTEAVWWAALFHDVLYVWKGQVERSPARLQRLVDGEWVRVREVGRKFADDLFEAGIRKKEEDTCEAKLDRHLIYWGVRALGYPVWVEGDFPDESK